MAGKNPWKVAWFVTVTVVLVVLLQVSVAALTSSTGKGVSQVKFLSETVTFSSGVANSSFVDLPGAVTNVTIPSAWSTGMIVVRFAGQSQCSGTTTTCSVRVLIGGVEAAPGPLGFDAAPESGGLVESNAMQAARAGLAPGSYEVKVQFTDGSSTEQFFLGRWGLTVERIRQT